ncbi:hypothetical protein VCUG_01899 [Vavraia culicis subsp. floridensis]|uniref:Uncharacterized protein n=1 Tax=Vavraia culicis (isolate floridensis) TaxID=948595 RepID=L2GU36_VAVCU|nr:uncharacterized protein VCUG_01899 [Vavraia culicis subsp. floridensis]ELA46615.1 hypothetical protein VCUG_01899 [Vavraia culicis subsp. floridensis]
MPLKHTKVFTTEVCSLHSSSPHSRVEMCGIALSRTRCTYTFVDFFGTCIVFCNARDLPTKTLCKIYGLIDSKGRVLVMEWERTCFYGEMAFLGEVVSLRKMKFYGGTSHKHIKKRK